MNFTCKQDYNVMNMKAMNITQAVMKIRSGKIQASTGFEPMTGMYALYGATHDIKLLHSIGTMGNKSTGKKYVV